MISLQTVAEVSDLREFLIFMQAVVGDVVFGSRLGGAYFLSSGTQNIGISSHEIVTSSPDLTETPNMRFVFLPHHTLFCPPY